MSVITKTNLASMLNGRSHGNEMQEQIEAMAKEANLVIAFCQNDDRLILRGKVEDSINVWFGGFVYFKNGKAVDPTQYKQAALNKMPKLKIEWQPKDKVQRQVAYWLIQPSFDHSKFETNFQNKPFCIGAVFNFNLI